jgi:hypothetical protein
MSLYSGKKSRAPLQVLGTLRVVAASASCVSSTEVSDTMVCVLMTGVSDVTICVSLTGVSDAMIGLIGRYVLQILMPVI